MQLDSACGFMLHRSQQVKCVARVSPRSMINEEIKLDRRRREQDG